MADAPEDDSRSLAEALEAIEVVDDVDVARCEGTIHVWSSFFAPGDACACGRFALSQGEDGRLRTVERTTLDA
jgi:hypothetical protein